jgi:hypothetical protein
LTHIVCFTYEYPTLLTYEPINIDMKTSSLVLSLAAAAVTIAQDSYYNISSPPFYLHVTSDDGKLNEAVGACHIGAAIESLCLSHIDDGEPVVGSPFNLNTSIWSQPPEPSFGVPGILTYVLRAQPPRPSSMYFSYSSTTNYVLPIIGPGDSSAQSVAFDAQNNMVIQGYVPLPNNTGTWKEYSRWYACPDTYYSGYRYNNLAWGLGAAPPENPSCVAVNVTRVFVGY